MVVARVALATCMSKILTSSPFSPAQTSGSSLVRAFLVTAVCQRLAFDLGESLEAAATGWRGYHKGLARLQDELMAAAAEVPDDPPGAGQWQGLPGWLWVTRVLEHVLRRFRDAGP